MSTLPILYSFVRCPYAIRARFALKYVGIQCILREVNLKNKPVSLLSISPKGTVPVLQFPDGTLLDESIKIMEWAIGHDSSRNEKILSLASDKKAQNLIEFNDRVFVRLIHKYKYRVRYPEDEYAVNKQALHEHMHVLNNALSHHTFLCSENISIADLALFPFIRQIFIVDSAHTLRFGHLGRWLDYFVQHPCFSLAMTKYPVWQPHDEPIIF